MLLLDECAAGMDVVIVGRREVSRAGSVKIMPGQDVCRSRCGFLASRSLPA